MVFSQMKELTNTYQTPIKDLVVSSLITTLPGVKACCTINRTTKVKILILMRNILLTLEDINKVNQRGQNENAAYKEGISQ